MLEYRWNAKKEFKGRSRHQREKENYSRKKRLAEERGSMLVKMMAYTIV